LRIDPFIDIINLFMSNNTKFMGVKNVNTDLGAQGSLGIRAGKHA
jgi:hypothetical protein